MSDDIDDKEIEPKEKEKRMKELKKTLRDLYPNYTYITFKGFGRDFYGVVMPYNDKLNIDIIRKYRKIVYKDLCIN
jgi:hypothetical protein